jgi:hypothetical protein
LSSVDLSSAVVAVPVSIWRCDVSGGASISLSHSCSSANGFDNVSPSVLFAGNFYRKDYIEMAKHGKRERKIFYGI